MKKLLSLVFAVCILSVSLLCVSADKYRVSDLGNLLTLDEEEQLNEKLAEISQRQNYDVVIITLDTMGYNDPAYYAEDLLFAKGFGDSRGAAILIVSADREWGMYSTDMSDYTMEDIGDIVLPYLSENDFAKAFDVFAEEIDSEITSMRTFPLAKNIFIALAIGLIIAFIVVSVLKGQLKSVRNRNFAGEYIRKDGFKLHRSRDLYLYSTITRVPRPRDNGGNRPGGGGGRGGGRAGGRF